MSPTQILLCPENLYAVCFKHIIQTYVLIPQNVFYPLKMYFAPSNLKTWLQASLDYVFRDLESKRLHAARFQPKTQTSQVTLEQGSCTIF